MKIHCSVEFYELTKGDISDLVVSGRHDFKVDLKKRVEKRSVEITRVNWLFIYFFFLGLKIFLLHPANENVRSEKWAVPGSASSIIASIHYCQNLHLRIV